MQNEIKSKATDKMAKAVGSLQEALGGLRAGRANPHILDKVNVDYYGAMTPLSQMAGISVPEARMIVIQPYDMSSMKAIEKAIIASDLGFNPSNDGKVIRLLVPQLTEERRKELVKKAKKYGEECKVSIRNIRRKAVAELKEAQKETLITEDDLKSAEKDLQVLTDNEIKSVDKVLKEKEAEILAV
ncbi:MAG: ribosome recycling factor [Eubacteriaceae bacterium]|jgi:ribosome recycling factor